MSCKECLKENIGKLDQIIDQKLFILELIGVCQKYNKTNYSQLEERYNELQKLQNKVEALIWRLRHELAFTSRI